MLLTRPMVRQLRPRTSTAEARTRRFEKNGHRSRDPRPIRRRSRASAASAAPSAWSRSAMMSSMCSMPTQSRIISGRTPAFSCSLRRHLPMRRRGRMAGERLGVADIDQPLEQLQRVVERLAGFEPAGDAEGQQRAGAAAEIFLRQRVIGIVGEAGVVDPVDARIVAQEFGDAARVLDVTLDAQRDRLDALQQQERATAATAPRRSCADRRCGSARYRRLRRNARCRPGRDRTRRAR